MASFKWYLLLFLFSIINAFPSNFSHSVGRVNETRSRSSRFYFPLFKVVSFRNDVCVTDDGLTGTCYTETECVMLKGRGEGVCAQGFGVCCFWDAECGALTTQNRTYFVNPGFKRPFNGERRCEMVVRKPTTPGSICQLRINFVSLYLAPPLNSRCSVDAFEVPHSSKMPVICGNNTGQHMYVDFAVPNELKLVITTTSSTFPRRWCLELLLIECTNPSIAPSGCLEYYWGKMGSVVTLNFACPPSEMFRPLDGQLARLECLSAELDYAICVRMESDMCAIDWNPVLFDIGPDGIITSQTGDNCQQNFITISGGFSMERPSFPLKTFDRFCGSHLNTEKDTNRSVTITTYSKPFIIRVKTGRAFVGPFSGAAFQYSQKVCV